MRAKVAFTTVEYLEVKKGIKKEERTSGRKDNEHKGGTQKKHIQKQWP